MRWRWMEQKLISPTWICDSMPMCSQNVLRWLNPTKNFMMKSGTITGVPLPWFPFTSVLLIMWFTYSEPCHKCWLLGIALVYFAMVTIYIYNGLYIVTTGKCADLDRREWIYLDLREWIYLDSHFIRQLNNLDHLWQLSCFTFDKWRHPTSSPYWIPSMRCSMRWYLCNFICR